MTTITGATTEFAERAPVNAGALSFRRVADDKRMRLRGLHHVTAISGDIDRTIAFYRDRLGLAIVHDAPSDDDPDARHVWFGSGDGTYVSFMEYPGMPDGIVGRGSTHHFALAVESEEELAGWRDYLRARGVPCTDVMERAHFKSIYLRDPDGHILELAVGRAVES
jgi:glyoxylase I family protein